jgi:hypothetical protein
LAVPGENRLQPYRILAALSRHPALRAGALLLVWLTVMLAPMGATLHAMSHLAGPTYPGVALAVMNSAPKDAPADPAISPGDESRDIGGTAAHCHICDEWQFLDHVVSWSQPPLHIPLRAGLLRTTSSGGRTVLEAPWILPRAPPVGA